QADRECGTSYAVLKGISEVYQRMGNSTLAALYAKNSNNYGSQRREGDGGVTPPPAAAEKSFVRDKFALIVGVGKFERGNIPKLKYAAKDATDFAALLTDPETGRFHKENVTVLTDGQATSRAIRSALADIARKAMKEDLVLLYFSTHGSSPSMDRSKIGSGYLVTHDTDVNDLYATAYGMDELANFMRQKINAERIVTFLDTCYSGDTTRILQQTSGSKALEVEALSDQAIGQIAQGRGSVVITSSSNRELSWESDEKQNSFFTLYLMESMKDRQGLANIKQIYTDLQRRIPSAVREYTRTKGLGEPGKGAVQNPVIYPISDIPDIVIGTPVK
ncbi:MAG: caspase family protein, partial [Bryobacterales bacterium]|nr:caspase family protein [Bryobacterales bacterium]